MTHYWWQMAVEVGAYDARTKHQKISSIQKIRPFGETPMINATIDLILQAVLLPFADASVRTLVTCGSLSSLGCMLDNHFLQ